MKKQILAKKQAKKEEKPAEQLQTTIPEGKWKGTVLIIVLFLGALAFVYTLSNDVSVTGNAISEKYKDSKASESFLQTLSALDAIDATYNVSLVDYKRGYIYLKNEPRYPKPFNMADMQAYLENLATVRAISPSAKLLLDARRSLVEAELHHKLSYKDYRGDIRLGTRCKFKPYVDETIAEQGRTLEFGNKAMDALISLQQNYPTDFAVLDISAQWMRNVKASLIDIEGEMNYNRIEFNKIWTENCMKEEAKV